MTIVPCFTLGFGFELGHLNLQEPNVVIECAVLVFGWKRTKAFFPWIGLGFGNRGLGRVQERGEGLFGLFLFA